MQESQEWAYVCLGVAAVAFVAFFSIPIALYLDYSNANGKLTNFIQMWQSFGVVSALAFIGTAIFFGMKKRPERFHK